VNPNAQQMFYQTTTEAEALYYIQNNSWPYNQYVTNYATSNPSIFTNSPIKIKGLAPTLSTCL
jgi:hypothetical protein